MKKFNTVFVLYSSLLGFAVGIVSELFLVTVNFLIHTIWYTLPHSLHLPNFYPIIMVLSVVCSLDYLKNTSDLFKRHYTKP